MKQERKHRLTSAISIATFVLVALALIAPFGCAAMEKAAAVVAEEGSTAGAAATGALIGGPWGAFLGALLGSLGYQLVSASLDVDALSDENRRLRDELAGLGHKFEQVSFFGRWWRWIVGGGVAAIVAAFFSRSPFEGFRLPHKRHLKKLLRSPNEPK